MSVASGTLLRWYVLWQVVYFSWIQTNLTISKYFVTEFFLCIFIEEYPTNGDDLGASSAVTNHFHLLSLVSRGSRIFKRGHQPGGTYYLAEFLPKNTWKWKPIGLSRGCTFLGPPRSATALVYLEMSTKLEGKVRLWSCWRSVRFSLWTIVFWVVWDEVTHFSARLSESTGKALLLSRQVDVSKTMNCRYLKLLLQTPGERSKAHWRAYKNLPASGNFKSLNIKKKPLVERMW